MRDTKAGGVQVGVRGEHIVYIVQSAHIYSLFFEFLCVCRRMVSASFLEKLLEIHELRPQKVHTQE